MRTNPAIREAIATFMEVHPACRMGEIVAHVLGLGMSTEQGIHSVMRNLVAAGVVNVDRTNPKTYRYTLNEEGRTVRFTHASRFQVPAELAGPIVPPMVWSMRHLLGCAPC